MIIILPHAKHNTNLGQNTLFVTSGWKLRKWHCPLPTLHPFISYLLGLLAMIKCCICSYQCDKKYVSNWRLTRLSIFAREVSSWACCEAFMCCSGMALQQHRQRINVAYTQRFAKCSNHLKRTHSRISFYKKNKPLTHKEMKLTSSNCTSKLPVAFPLPVRVRRLENQVAFIAPWSNARSEC